MTRIKSLGEFSDFIASLIKEYRGIYNHSLEDYLRSLLVVVNKRRYEKVTADLLAEVITEAFTTEPIGFDPDWLSYQKAYFGWDYKAGGYVPKVLEGYNVREVKHGISDFELLTDVLLFQIADLHRMQDDPRASIFETRSPTGNIWQNTGVFSILECGMAGLIDHSSRDLDMTKCDWADLAALLDSGRLYE